MDDRTSAEEADLFEKREERKDPMMERRRTKAEGWRHSDAAGVGVNWEAHPKPKALEVKASTLESLGLASYGRAHLGSKVRRRRGRQWYGKSRHTQEYKSCQQNDMEVDKEEGMED